MSSYSSDLATVATAVVYEKSNRVFRVKVPGTSEAFFLHPATVRRNDTSAKSIDEWTGDQRLKPSDVPENIEPVSVSPMGNYAVSIIWPDGFNQVAPFEHLQSIERLVDVPDLQIFPSTEKQISSTSLQDISKEKLPSNHSNAAAILQHARVLKERKESRNAVM